MAKHTPTLKWHWNYLRKLMPEQVPYQYFPSFSEVNQCVNSHDALVEALEQYRNVELPLKGFVARAALEAANK